MNRHCLLLALLPLSIYIAESQDELSDLKTAPIFRHDYTFYKEANGHLKYHEIPANFAEARLRCHLEGATLASPITHHLEIVINHIMKLSKPSNGILTGIHAFFSRGDFFSVEGVPFPYIHHTWAEGQPNNLLNQQSCMKLDLNGQMSDVCCEAPLPYICFKEAGHYKLNECGTTDNDYHFYSETGSCYKFHRLPRPWSRAFMTCAAEGGQLAIINSETEAQVIRDIFNKNPAETIKGKAGKDQAFIGCHDWGEHGDFLTIQGETLEEAGYEKWSPGEPNNGTEAGEFCLSVYRSGLLNDISCEDHFAFICEKSLKF